ncbi:MtrB/PioB family decaheme-associated outer membrane protein [Ferrimonas aestuarii]|uniref:MtrB/PioB family decaheme-associated outer membrane protein n=1 Tax=Ferrimonas aestuarii TaxID=2569539 RepID=A0A4V5NY68_9GAMM|nr:MtrB/PioB family decaheme-associated outer membrane protein [Ferrimonas aestuarii]TKB56594.1 MtrB/PioB family decaheme-associated outer membrane protein [Ferrimonas aestuarii]
MKYPLSVLALALMQAGMAHASSLNLSEANLERVNTDRWDCKRCTVVKASGELGVSAVATDADNAVAANRLGEDSEGMAALQADLAYQQQGDRIRVQAHNLGMETGHAKVDAKGQNLGLTLGYQSQLSVNADEVQTQYQVAGDQLIAQPGEVTLQSKRERFELGTDYQRNIWRTDWRTYAEYAYLEQTGAKATSTNLNKAPINFARPIDTTTQSWETGLQAAGQSWTGELSYQGSLFENDHQALNDGDKASLQAGAPGNESHQVSALGQYRFASSHLTGQLVKGWMYQNDNYVDTQGVPTGITHLNGEVETLDARLRYSHKLSRDFKLGMKVDYRDRDNKTPIQLFHSVNYDPQSGQAIENVALDTSRTAYQLDGRYRLAKGLVAKGGYQYIEKEQSDTVREQTDESRFFASLDYTALANWNFGLDAEYGSRDGSAYQASAATSEEDNELLRKYHLADRDRTKFELSVTHTPWQQLSMDLRYHYAEDDYGNSELGLTESKDYGYDFSLSFQANDQVSFHAFGAQQWIESTQAGSQSFSSADWVGEVEDSFSYIGAGTRYDGLMQDRLALGLDYSFNESESDTSVSGQTPYGDYISWSHNVHLYAEYALTEHATLKANYRYERYYDTDYAEVGNGVIPGLTTLGNLASDYNAHQLMLTFSYLM